MSWKWRGAGLCAIGGGLLAIQAYAYLDVGLISGWLIGGGIGLVAAGAISWYYDWDDRRSGSGSNVLGEDHLPTADEYERHLTGLDGDEPNPREQAASRGDDKPGPPI